MAINVPKTVLTRAAQWVCHYNNPEGALREFSNCGLTPEQKERVENVIREANDQTPPMKVKDLKKALVVALKLEEAVSLSHLFANPQLLEKILPFLGSADKISLRTVCKSGESVVSWPIKLQWYQAVMPKMTHYLNFIKAEPCCETSQFSPAGTGYCCYHCELPGLSLTEARKQLVPEKYDVFLGECWIFNKEAVAPDAIEQTLSALPSMMCDMLVPMFGEPLAEKLAARGKEIIGETYVEFRIPTAVRNGIENDIPWRDQETIARPFFSFPISLLGLPSNGENQLSIRPAIDNSYCIPIHGKLFEFAITERAITRIVVNGGHESFSTYGTTEESNSGTEDSDESSSDEVKDITTRSIVDESYTRPITSGMTMAITISYIPAMDAKENTNLKKS